MDSEGLSGEEREYLSRMFRDLLKETAERPEKTKKNVRVRAYGVHGGSRG